MISGPRWRWGASAAAVVAALAVVGLARWSGNDLEVDGRGQVTSVPLGAVVFATVLGVVAASILRKVSLRTVRPRRTYGLLAGLGLMVSSVPPLTAATETATAAWLLLAHAAVAAVLLPAFAPGKLARVSTASNQHHSGTYDTQH